MFLSTEAVAMVQFGSRKCMHQGNTIANVIPCIQYSPKAGTWRDQCRKLLPQHIAMKCIGAALYRRPTEDLLQGWGGSANKHALLNFNFESTLAIYAALVSRRILLYVDTNSKKTL